MIHVARFVLGAVVVGFAATVGCVFSPFYSSEGSGGQAGTTTGTGGTGGGVPCSSAAPCEDVDKNPCTQEACTNGVCASVPLTLNPGPGSTECITVVCENGALPKKTIHGDKACGTNLKCTAQGDCAGCMNADQCGKTDECRKPTCRADMTCIYEYMPLGTKVNALLQDDKPDDCMATICDGNGKIVLYLDTTDAPDNQVCTVGQCVEGKPMQTPLAVGTACAGGKSFCNASQICVQCASDANCAMGETCYQETGCVSCADGKKNGTETDSDCGGSCKACADQQACAQNKDCTSVSCDNGTCISCFDGVQNGGEAGVDCGGAICLACPGAACSVASQCALKFCEDAVCCNKACTDPCKSCNLAGKAGLCSDAPLGLADPACPSGTPVCQAGVCVDAKGKKSLGAPCTGNNDCFSDNCQGPINSKICN